ncbi:MAG: hypothetical protein WCP90_01980 [Opitutae bacterium]
MTIARHLFAFLFFAASIFNARAADLSTAQIIEKARAAVAKEPKFLERIKGLHFEIKFVDAENKPLSFTIIQLIGPKSRRELSYNENYSVEVVTACNGLEGWKSTREINGQKRAQNLIIPYDQVAILRDMTINDLAFYSAPAEGTGSVSYLGKDEINGKKVYSVEYKFNSGFKITRHFGVNNFELVAYDQKSAKGEIHRQQVEETEWVEGVCFVKRETILVNGKKVAEAIYEKTSINPEVAESSFAFPLK